MKRDTEKNFVEKLVPPNHGRGEKLYITSSLFPGNLTEEVYTMRMRLMTATGRVFSGNAGSRYPVGRKADRIPEDMYRTNPGESNYFLNTTRNSK
jgi:hypothetical protein